MSRHPKRHYDAELMAVDPACRQIWLRVGRECITAQCAYSVTWPVGTLGTVRFGKSPDRCTFHPYLDQRMHRSPELDEKKPLRWAWRIGKRVVHAKPHVTPGVNGAVIHDETQLIHMAIPPEFVELCRSHKLTPHVVLRAFIADLCGICNFLAYPREDHFSSHGSDERMLAEQYFYRAFGRTPFE